MLLKPEISSDLMGDLARMQDTTDFGKRVLPKHSEISVAPVSSVVLLSGQRKQKYSDLLG